MEYLQEDLECTFHEDDPYLDKITIKLPKLEEWYSSILGRDVSREEALTYVDGYGLKPEDQRFKRTVVPDKIKMIYSIVFQKKHVLRPSLYKSESDVTPDDIFEELSLNERAYKMEIEWIKREIKRRLVGYWCFIKGKPTYLNGANYFFLNYWKIKNFGKNDNFPDYRDYQRKMFHILMYAYTTEDAFFRHRVFVREGGKVTTKYTNSSLSEIVDDCKENNYTYVTERDINVMVKQGKRTVHGVNFISGRRVAKTAISCCFCTWGTLNMPDQTFIIQGMNQEQAVDKVFIKQIQTPISKLPFFFLPKYRGILEATSRGLRFQYDPAHTTMARAGLIPEQMECFITPLSSAEKAADGEAEIAFVYRDEPGKKTDEKASDQNIEGWWFNTMKPAIERGEYIRGFAILPTTVGDMKSGGGSQFLSLVEKSHFCNRNDNGETDSGLINIFLPGRYAVEGFIDSYGFSIIEDPEEPVLASDGKYKTIGARTYLANKAKSLEKAKDYSNLIKHQQNFPESWIDAFSIIPEDMGMPIEKMRDRISELKFAKVPLTKRVSFKWEGDKFGGNVTVEDDPKGDWTMSYLPPTEHRNRRTVVSSEDGFIPPPDGGLIYAPEASVMGKFFLCCDPVKFDKRNTVGKKKSKPAAAVFYVRDNQIDPDSKPRSEWVSNDFILTYKKDINMKDEYHEEWLKACIFLGAYLYPEYPDGEEVTEYFRERGFDGYLLRDMGVDGIAEKVPGVYATLDNINKMLGDVMSYFDGNVRYMKHIEIIEEWTQMRGRDDLTNHDLCAASGWCMRAIKSRIPELFRAIHEPVEIHTGFVMYDGFDG